MTNSISNQPVFPHIKLTDETFPRALATRILKEDGSEYFGAFLNRTNVRILIDFLNKPPELPPSPALRNRINPPHHYRVRRGPMG
jgi:excinuclease ABC subunit C